MTQQTDPGMMKLAPGVIDTIISITANEVEGVASVGSRVASGLRSMLAVKPSTAGIETTFDDAGKLDITLHIEVYYGYVLPDLADKLRRSIADALMVQVGIEVSQIDIYVDGIQFAQS